MWKSYLFYYISISYNTIFLWKTLLSIHVKKSKLIFQQIKQNSIIFYIFFFKFIEKKFIVIIFCEYVFLLKKPFLKI